MIDMPEPAHCRASDGLTAWQSFAGGPRPYPCRCGLRRRHSPENGRAAGNGERWLPNHRYKD